jgi:hypothetical protein
MEKAKSVSLFVKCPHCGNKFTPDDAIGHDIRVQMEKEFDKRLEMQSRAIADAARKQEHERFQLRIQMLEDDRNKKSQRLTELKKVALNAEQLEAQLKASEQNFELELKKRLFERERLIREQAEKTAMDRISVDFREKELMFAREREALQINLQKKIYEESEKAREEERMRAAELQKKLDDQSKLILEMKRKSEQGSMQLQGEIQELAIEEYLQENFPRDVIEEVSKGKRGGDCVHIVKDHFSRVCGRILYESKRTKHFSAEWIPKVKEDMRLKQADIGVIVTEALPEGMTRFGERDGIWLCTFHEFKAFAYLFRCNLLRIGEILASQENKGDKMQLIYSYVTGNEFKQKLEAAFEAYNDLQEDLQKEKTLMMSQWAKREKKLYKAMENLISLYGDVRGIAGGAVQEIKALEIPQDVLYFNQ